MKEGIYYGMSRAEYDAIEAMNQSSIKRFLSASCPARYKWELSQPRETSDAMTLGTLVDDLVTNPDCIENKFAVWTGKVRRGKEWDKFQEDNQDRIHIKQDQWQAAKQMAGKLNDLHKAHCPDTQKAVVVSEINGILCKGEVDLLDADGNFIGDIKTTKEDASNAPDRFGKVAHNLGYHIQAAFYMDLLEGQGIKFDLFHWLVVEQAQPHACGLYYAEADDLWIKVGRDKYRNGMRMLADCILHNEWPEHGTGVKLQTPKWIA